VSIPHAANADNDRFQAANVRPTVYAVFLRGMDAMSLTMLDSA
jgi:hypothetical protein